MTAATPNDFARNGAQWLAAIGVALLGVAAVSLASARWDQFGPSARLTILLIASAVVFSATRALGRVAPDTTRALDVLVATLIPIDVAGLVIVSGGTWRPALVAAGPAAVISSELLRRRYRTFVTELGTAAGGLLAMCGVAALYGISAAVLVSALGLMTVLVAPGGRHRWFGVTWAVVGGLTPALRVLDDAVFTGMGTLREIGLLDAAEIWETAVSGGVATAALIVVATVQKSSAAALGALAVTVATGLQIWGEVDPPTSVGFVAAAVALVGVELALALPASRAVAQIRVVEDVVAVVAGMFTMVVVAEAWVGLVGEEAPATHLQFTACVLALYWLVGDLRRASNRGTRGLAVFAVGGLWEPALPGTVAASGAAVYFGTDSSSVLGVGLIALAMLSISTRRPFRLSTTVAALAVAPFVPDSDAITLAVSAVATVTIAWLCIEVDRRPEIGLVHLVGALAVATTVPGAVAAAAWGLQYSGAFWLVVLWLAGRLVGPTMPHLGIGFRIAAQIGVVIVSIDEFGVAAGLAALAAVLHGVEYLERRTTVHLWLGAVSATMSWVFMNAALGTDIVDAYVLPPLWLLTVAIVRLGVHRSRAIAMATSATVVITVLGRFSDGRPVHTLILGATALGLAAWGAVSEERIALVFGGAVAVATATFEGLDQSMGIETWGWLVVGGVAAVTAAGLLETHPGQLPRSKASTPAGEVSVS